MLFLDVWTCKPNSQLLRSGGIGPCLDCRPGDTHEDQTEQYFCRQSGQGAQVLHRGSRLSQKQRNPREFKWVTVISPESPADVELVLEPNANPAAKEFQEAIFKQGIPITAFEVDDIESEFARLKALGVVFTMELTAAGPVDISILSDTCGNLIQLYQPK